MATTTKTLTPTNQTITLPDMTERPNASVLVDGIGKDADAINALSEHIGNQTLTTTAQTLDGAVNELNAGKAIQGNKGIGGNIDDILSAGIYYLDGTNNYTRYGVLIVAKAGDNKRYQVFFQNDGNVKAIRAWNGSAWGSWNNL